MRTAGCQSVEGASTKSSISDENEVLADSLDELVESAMSTGAQPRTRSAFGPGPGTTERRMQQRDCRGRR